MKVRKSRIELAIQVLEEESKHFENETPLVKKTVTGEIRRILVALFD